MRLLRRSFGGLGYIVCLGVLTCGCGSRSVPPVVLSPPPASDPLVTAPPPENAAADCALIADPGEPIATVALSERVDPANAPHPSNDSERLLFRQLYETLVRVDCEGRLRPGLAASWRLDADERTWTVMLRDDARFSDGTPVTTADVLSSWTRGIGGGLRPQASRFVQSIVPVDDRVLTIRLRAGAADAPLVLADTNLAIAKPSSGSPWPLGTRSARIAPDQVTPDASGRMVITLDGLGSGSPSPNTSDTPWSVRFIVFPDRDRRDFLDEGVDLLLTRDPATLEYAATLPRFQSVPLAWHRIHVFLSPWRAASLPQLSAEARQSLADEAVRGEARGAEGPFWWQSLPNCDVARPRPRDQPPPTTGRIVYERGDDASRDLAERFVGLARVSPRLRSGQAPPASSGQAAEVLDALLSGTPSQTFQRAIGLTGEALTSAQDRGTDTAYVMSFDRVPLDPCRQLRAVVDRIGWLDPDTIVPLVDTRLRAITRRGRSGVTVEWDGGLLITSAGAER